MADFIGAICPYCNQELKISDELAVCPECGTPHHRACYKEHGECANRELHAAGFEWRRPVNENTAPEAESCPECGRMNPRDSERCAYCGAAFVRPERPFAPTSPNVTVQPESPIESVISEDETLDNIPVSDWMTYIGTNQYYYLYNIYRQSKTGSKLGFTMVAVFFPFLYFMYRKLWGAAAISFFANLLLSVPAAISQVLAPMGLDFGVAAATWETLSVIGSVALCVLNCFWGLSAVYLFRTTARNRIYRLHAISSSEDEYHWRLQRAGGPSRLALVLVCGVYASVLLIVSLITNGMV